MKKVAIIVLVVLLLDQCLKVWIKLNMFIGQEYNVFGQWFIIHFTENEGMAFGFSFGGSWGKLALSIFRILAVAGIGYYLWGLTKTRTRSGVIVGMAFILAGAIGNILDSALYGLFFSESTYYQVATLFPEGGGYAGFLHGKVVDMLYFPLIQTTFPTWFPIWGGEPFQFFRPVFNLADASITSGVVYLLLFERSFFKKIEHKEEQPC
ncbi:MAG: lipoprotein signal peptidase [Bacteroidales bacterium]|nr:lipoprotein signal peptidase [Bacteroidales bacterium]MDD3663819.1 lipoprotein signal peptidase [Bacteroidales bacterium]